MNTSYRVIQKHVCDLPDPAEFADGTEIKCTGYDAEHSQECWKRYCRATRFWTRRPYWMDWWGW